MDFTDNPSYQSDVNDFIEFAENLKKRIAKLGSVQGLRKLERKIGAELKFMTQLKQRDQHTQQSRLKSSNLGHLASLVHAAERLRGVSGVLVPYQLPTRHDSLLVDLLALRGRAWVKIVARKAQALHLVWAGAGRFGERDLLCQAHEYLECAARYPVNFCTPQVHFAFYNQVTESMAAALERLGVTVWGERVPVDPLVLDKLQGLVWEDSSQDSEGSDDDRQDDLDKDDLAKEKKSPSYVPSQHSRSIHSQDELDKDDLADEKNSLCLDLSGASHFPSTQPPSVNNHGIFSDDLRTERSQDHKDSTAQFVVESVPSVSYTDNDSLKDPSSCEHSIVVFAECVQTSAAAERSQLACGRDLSGPESKDLFLELVVSPPTFDSFGYKSALSEKIELSLQLPDSLSSATCLSGSLSAQSAEGVSEIQRVNLDITSLIALVSSVTNGRCHFVFQDKVLTEQAREEREDPVLPVLNRFLAGKELFACETAVSSFRSILTILGGAEENQRAADFLARVTILPDQPSPRAMELRCQGRVKERSKIVFGTGDSLHAVTVTSNMGFVRAAQSQGVNFPVFLHSARALTEEKEPSAEPL